MQKRVGKTFEKNPEKTTEISRMDLKKLKSLEFACESDARGAAELWIQDRSLFVYQTLEIEAVNHRVNNKRGRPAQDEPCITKYIIRAELERDNNAVDKTKEKVGRFVLATNDLTLSPDDLLAYYKGHGVVEQGFRFLKDKSFRIAEIFLKKPSRVQALAKVMTLGLFVYSLTEFRLRK